MTALHGDPRDAAAPDRADTEPPRSVVCHEWLTTYGGSEQVAADLARLVDAAEVYTFAKNEDLAVRMFPGVPVRAVLLGHTRLAQRNWQWMLPAMPRTWRSFDTSDADLVVTSSHACANAVPPVPGQVRVSYCHTPMRYAWDWRQERRRLPAAMRPALPAVAALLRRRDRAWSTNVDVYVANSRFTADRIRDAYGRAATVVHPAVDTDYWCPDPGVATEDFLLVAGRLVAYKRPDIVIRAANAARRRLVVTGDGPMLADLMELAGPTVEFVPRPTRDELRVLYRRATAMVYPQVEEFGITLVEAAACGTPALARRAGGALETVEDGLTGRFFDNDADLARAVRHFDPSTLDPQRVVTRARRFGRPEFERKMRAVVAEAVARHSTRPDRDEWAARLRTPRADRAGRLSDAPDGDASAVRNPPRR